MPDLSRLLAPLSTARRRTLGALRSPDLHHVPAAAYGPDPRQRLSIWRPLTDRPPDGWPTVLLLHGGGWVSGSRRHFDSFAPALAARGLQCVAADYRLGPAHRWPAQREDTLAALDALDEHDADMGRVCVWGHSAGGHLALDCATRRTLAAVVALGAPADITEPRHGADVFDDAQRAGASPARHLTPTGAPILLVHGERDPVCDVQQARDLAAALTARCTLIEVPGGNHGLQWPPLRCLTAREDAVRWVLDRLGA